VRRIDGFVVGAVVGIAGMVRRQHSRPYDGEMAARVRTRDVRPGSGDAAVDAYVVEPTGAPARAGILFLHWLGEHRSDRTQFLSEARDYARRGITGVLPAGRLPWEPDPLDAETDIANIELEQRRLGAALDALIDRVPDGAPIALVGHDFGAMHGLLLGSRRPVFAAIVVIAATPRWGDWFLRFWKVRGDRFDYLRSLAPLDPIEAARSLAAPTLWQFSSRDFYIAPMSAVELARAAPVEGGEQRIEWYAADHAMRSAKARAARRQFLVTTLGLA
jgi:pimeloyl-ACP methyl ester carboxylesterase